MFKNLRITCDEATMICDKSQYGASTLLNRLKLNIHFIGCKKCILYTKQNVKLTDLYKGYSHSCKGEKHTLSLEDKEALKKTFKLKS